MKGKMLERLRAMSATRIIALAFLAIIVLGTALLLLPAASRNGRCCGIVTAIFTATSATCVTGLTLCDTWTQWSILGQIIVLALIQIGGLGFMSAASIVIFALKKKFGMRQRFVIAQSLGFDSIGGVIKLQKLILKGSLLIEAAGAVVLTTRFCFQYPFLKALWMGVFHSVSAFCNAGFDILGFISPGGSVSPYALDPVVMLTLMALIVLGGLGFIVWQEIVTQRSFRKLSVYAKLVLITTGVLVFGGTALFLTLEWNNPATIGNMRFGEKLLAALFQSVTTRTAGFAALDQGLLTGAGKAVTIMLMLVGGSSGSTAGGIKTVTLVVIVLYIISHARGKRSVHVFNRTIPGMQAVNAMTIFGIFVFLSMAGAIIVCATSPVSLEDGLYEAASALATVGLTAGATAHLALPAKIIIMLYMYFGRVGVLTISLGFLEGDRAEEKYKFAETNLLIG